MQPARYARDESEVVRHGLVAGSKKTMTEPQGSLRCHAMTLARAPSRLVPQELLQQRTRLRTHEPRPDAGCSGVFDPPLARNVRDTPKDRIAINRKRRA